VAESTTIIAALKFQGGVVIAADSQASDIAGEVRWPVEKLDRIGTYPCVIGFSGAGSRAEQARSKLNSTPLHSNMFNKSERIQGAVYRSLRPVYDEIKRANECAKQSFYLTSLWGLMAFWAEDTPHILECGINGDCEFHQYFHAIGSGAKTAYAIYRTLGGTKLCNLDERWAIPVILRILRTCVGVELWGISEPIYIWVISGVKARRLSDDEIQAQLQTVDEWEEGERSAFFSKAITQN
jgi:ATP-dependent protease HslVU (ClpYQ) peptidase subunit